jgi:hypothetical protein
MTREVAILGCGPAGLMAAHAVTMNGDVPYLLAVKQKSVMFGAMYLHRSIYGITELMPEGVIEICKYGTSAGYAEKVYGYKDAPVSFNKFQEGKHPTWDLRKAYDRLWTLYGDKVHDLRLGPSDVMALCRNFELVLVANHRAPGKTNRAVRQQTDVQSEG